MKKNKRQKQKMMRCPYCGGNVELRSAEGIYKEDVHKTMLLVCRNYPECDAYVRVLPGTQKPVGTMANGKLRAMRNTAHRYFDMIHKSGLMTKNEAYQWLAYKVCAPLSQAHIGLMGEYYCQQTINESKKLLISHGILREEKREAG